FAIYDFSRGVRTKLTLLAIGRNTHVTFRRRTAQLAGRRLRHFRVERPKLDARPVWRRAGDLHRRDAFRPEPQPATDLHLGRSVDKERCVRISLGWGQRSTTHVRLPTAIASASLLALSVPQAALADDWHYCL